MNMAAAVSATSGSSAGFALASLRGGFPTSSSSDQTTDGFTRADSANDSGKESAYPRFVSPVLEYNQGAERMVMLFRDPTTGKTEDQIPSEAALKQYREAVQRTRSQRNSESLAKVGDSGAGSDTAGSGSQTTGSQTKGALAKGGDGSIRSGDGFASVDGPTGATPGTTPPAPSGYGDTGAPVAASGGSVGNGSAGVRFNLVV